MKKGEFPIHYWREREREEGIATSAYKTIRRGNVEGIQIKKEGRGKEEGKQQSYTTEEEMIQHLIDGEQE